MNFIKIVLAILGLIFGVMLFFWVIGFLYSIVWYALWVGILGAIGYGGWKLFRKLEDKTLGAGNVGEIDGVRDIHMSWDEYQRKYLQK
jgi:hypothetical protein